MTNVESKALYEMYHNPNPDKREKAKEMAIILINTNIRAIIAQYCREGYNQYDKEDMYQNACMAALQALGRYDPDKSIWSTWAVKYVNNIIMASCYEKIYNTSRHKAKKYNVQAIVSLDTFIDNAAEDITGLDILAGSNDTEKEAERNLDNEILRERIKEIIEKCCSPLQAKCLTLKYGLDGRNPLEYAEIAEITSKTAKQVRYAVCNAKHRLKASEEFQELRKYM